MGFFGETGGCEDLIQPAWEGIKTGCQWGLRLGMAFALLLRVTLVVAVALVLAIKDGLVSFVRRLIAGIKPPPV
jgi:hypothetical protein